MSARILVVAEDPALQGLLSHSGRAEGHDVLVALTGPDGLRRWSADRPDLIILDAVLPGLDGFAMVERIRASEGSGAHVPIIMLGADADVASKVRGLRAGADDFLAKPLHPLELTVRMRGLLSRFASREKMAARSKRGQVLGYYGAKGGVGATTVAINSAIALARGCGRKVALVDANLQFGDHRVFLDLGTDRRSISDAVIAPSIDADLLRDVVVHHDSGVDVLLAPPTPEAAEHVSADAHHLVRVVETLRGMYDYVVVDLDQRLDDHSLDVISVIDTLFVVLTADLSCIKNVRLVLETMRQIGLPDERVQLFMNRSNAFTGISLKSVEGVLRRRIEHQVVNDYRVAISALNSGEPFMQRRADSLIGRSLLAYAKVIDEQPVQEGLLSPAEAAGQKLIPALATS